MKLLMTLIAGILILAPMLQAQDNLLKEYKGDSTHYVEYDVAPQPVRQIMPSYPDSAKTAGIEGVVYAELYINEEGLVKKVNVLKTSDPVFNDAAASAAKGWEFTPATKGGKPVAVWVVLPFKFKLGDDKN